MPRTPGSRSSVAPSLHERLGDWLTEQGDVPDEIVGFHLESGVPSRSKQLGPVGRRATPARQSEASQASSVAPGMRGVHARRPHAATCTLLQRAIALLTESYDRTRELLRRARSRSPGSQVSTGEAASRSFARHSSVRSGRGSPDSSFARRWSWRASRAAPSRTAERACSRSRRTPSPIFETFRDHRARSRWHPYRLCPRRVLPPTTLRGKRRRNRRSSTTTLPAGQRRDAPAISAKALYSRPAAVPTRRLARVTDAPRRLDRDRWARRTSLDLAAALEALARKIRDLPDNVMRARQRDLRQPRVHDLVGVTGAYAGRRRSSSSGGDVASPRHGPYRDELRPSSTNAVCSARNLSTKACGARRRALQARDADEEAERVGRARAIALERAVTSVPSSHGVRRSRGSVRDRDASTEAESLAPRSACDSSTTDRCD